MDISVRRTSAQVIKVQPAVASFCKWIKRLGLLSAKIATFLSLSYLETMLKKTTKKTHIAELMFWKLISCCSVSQWTLNAEGLKGNTEASCPLVSDSSALAARLCGGGPASSVLLPQEPRDVKINEVIYCCCNFITPLLLFFLGTTFKTNKQKTKWSLTVCSQHHALTLTQWNPQVHVMSNPRVSPSREVDAARRAAPRGEWVGGGCGGRSCASAQQMGGDEKKKKK